MGTAARRSTMSSRIRRSMRFTPAVEKGKERISSQGKQNLKGINLGFCGEVTKEISDSPVRGPGELGPRGSPKSQPRD